MTQVRVSPGVVGIVIAAGFLSLFATYWDDAWHTDIGRDDALIPPHLLLYGAVAVIGTVVAGWGLLTLRRTRSVVAVLRQRPLLVSAAGGLVTLASAPADAAWHEAFGRDAVIWSPPHMLTVFGSLALLCGVLAGLRATAPKMIWWAGGALLLGSATMAVLEFETDVPQFSERLYLPVLLVAALYAVRLVRTLMPLRHAVTGAVFVYVVVRLSTTGVLLFTGHTAPDLPLGIIGLAAADLPWRRPLTSYAAGAAGISVTTLLAAVLGVASVSAEAVLLPALGAIAICAAMAARDADRPAAAAGIAAMVPLVLPMAANDRAWAHDPGQGRVVGRVLMTVSTDGRGDTRLIAEFRDGCAGLDAGRVAARRAGRTVRGRLDGPPGGCRYTGRVRVEPSGLWFVYLETRTPSGRAEAWLPVDAAREGTVQDVKDLYLPAGRRPAGSGQVVAGGALYLTGLAALALTLRPGVSRRRA